MAYTFNYTTIGAGQNTDYIDQLKDKLMAKMLFEGRTMEYAKVIPGVKNKITLNLLANTAEPQTATCGWDKESNKYVNLNQKELTVCPLEIKDSLCPKDFEQLYLGNYLKTNKEIPFEQLIAESYINKAMNFNEKIIWDKGGCQSGLITMIDNGTGASSGFADNGVIDASTAVSGASTAIEAVNAMLAAATPDILMHTDKIFYTSYAFYNEYVSELRHANAYILANSDYKNGELAKYEIFIPGTDIKMVAMAGMDNLTTPIARGYKNQPMILTYKDNIVIGTDMLNDEETFDMWYSRDFDEVRTLITYKLGWQFYFGEHIVKGYSLYPPPKWGV